MQDTRFESLKLWLDTLPKELGLKTSTLAPASSDASFRRYFRVQANNQQNSSFIVMDAPPDKEDSKPFIHVAQLLLQAQIEAPKVFQTDLDKGFLLLSDLGSKTLYSEIKLENAAHFYNKVSSTLVKLQKSTLTNELPQYDAVLLRRELELFPDWYLAKHLDYQMTEKERFDLSIVFDELIASILKQATVFVHRDFHSRNLMITPSHEIGVLDFQDAVIGPITYDLVSIFRDAYLEWSEEQQVDWMIRYWEMARKEALPVPSDFGEFYQDIEWMGLQRHLKILGIFARLFHRDAKEGYLKDIPLVLAYTEKVAQRYSIFRPLVKILDNAQKRLRPDGLTF
jgi:aminoglycoside/choline kinase family phosphotransferase